MLLVCPPINTQLSRLDQLSTLHLILWIRNPETLTRPLGFLIFTTAFKKFAWSPRALGQFLIPQAILRCSLSISSDFALLLKRCVSTRGFGCTDRELLAPQICRDMAVFVPTERPNRWVMVGHLREATEGDERYIEICPTPPARSYSFMLVG